MIENSLRRQRVFRDRLNPMEAYSDFDFIARYRITKYMFVDLLNKISIKLHRSTARSHSNAPTTQLAVALQFLATGTFQTVIASAHGISQTSVSRCVTAVTRALTSIVAAYINFPNTTQQRVIQEYFLKKYKFPLVLRCIDGSYVPILAPSTNEDFYVNRKGFHYINIQAICDHEFHFISAIVKWPGCTHDAFICRQSGINREMTNGGIETVHGLFLSDSALDFVQI